MAMVLVVLTFAAFIALDYFVFSKRRVEAAAGLVPLPAVRQQVPAGIYLQPTFTWSRIGRAGEAYVGVHPMLLGLVGEPAELEFRSEGERVEKGEPLVRIGRAGRRLTVRSPVAGRVEHVNTQVTGETQWRDLEENDGSWLYRIQPERVADELPRWLSGEQAADWVRRQYAAVREFLYRSLDNGEIGVVMADGGEVPIGILGEMDQAVWAGLEERFLADVG